MGDQGDLLAKAQALFDEGKYEECERALLKMSNDDLKAQHNLALIRLLMNKANVDQTLASLEGPEQLVTTGGALIGSPALPRIPWLYEGYEAVVFNRAVLLARSGRAEMAVGLLRGLLQLGNAISIQVLGRALCLFQVVTRSLAKQGDESRRKIDEALIQTVLSDNMESFSKDPALMSMVKVAISDAIHEEFKAQGSEADKAVYFNNLAIINMNDDKFNVASLCFARAQKCVGEDAGGHVLIKQAIAYNAGLCALFRGDHEAAVWEFASIQEGMKQSPVFWIRFSEAALALVDEQRKRCDVEEHEGSQDLFLQQLSAGKMFTNSEFLLLPGAASARGPFPDISKDSTNKLETLQRLAAKTIQNAIFLLIPTGTTCLSALEVAPQATVQLIQYALLYWCTWALYCKNYTLAASVGQDLLATHDAFPLPSTLHTTLLSYMVESMIHVNAPEVAIKLLRHASLSGLLFDPTHTVDASQRVRVEALFINLAVAHITSGNWTQAHAVVDSLLAKIYEDRANNGAWEASLTPAEKKSGESVLFTYHMLAIFLELAQGNHEKAAELMEKVV